nr:helicase-like protein [Tanacetum cinerariifolium]
MTSFGAKIDESINHGRGPYVFKVSGQVYHWIGSLCPPPGESPRFLQLYIYDTDHEVENKMRHFGGIYDSDLDLKIVKGLIHFLDAHNQLVQLFRTDRNKCREIHIPEFKIRLYNAEGARGYELSASNQYVVGVYCVIEQSRLDYIRKKQKDIRGDHLSGLYDAISRGEKDGYEVGGRIILSMSFTGGLEIKSSVRGLPHCHTLLWVHSKNKIKVAQDVDRFISAELSDPKIDPQGYRVVSDLVMHGPCGAAKMSASCMKRDKCSKNFSKKYTSHTFFDDKGQYISKGTDRVFSRVCKPLGDSSNVPGLSRPTIDEIQKYHEGRFVCAHEACWRILKFDIHLREPAVKILAVHLQGMQMITFRDKDNLESVVNLHGRTSTTLTEWFAYNEANEDGKSSIGRLAYVHPTSGELFYFRILLCHKKGCTQFIDVQMINDVFYPTYRGACEALGLLGDDKESDIAMQEASMSVTLSELRFIFAHSLTHYDVIDPFKLWGKYWSEMGHDIPGNVSERVNIVNYHLNDQTLQGYILYELEIILSDCGKSLQHFGLPLPPQDLIDMLANSTLRSEEKIVLAVASSGIASLLLPSGRTTHSRFKLPLGLTEESLCRITKNSHLGKCLRDILTEPHSLFGGKSVLLGGDFRQTLPVQKGASKMKVISSCISESELWSHFKVFTLTENMHLEKSNISADEHSLISSFASCLLNIGDRNMGDPDLEDPENTSWVDIPIKYCIPDDKKGLQNLINFIYDQNTLQTPSAITLQQKAIVCPKNETADTINSKVLEMVQGETKIYLSHDEARPVDNDGAETEMLYPVEHLNTLKLPGYPPHRLELKVGAPVMLLRNVNVAGGLCNGTRMIVKQIMTKLIEVQIITGTRVGEKVFIHRISLIHKDPNLPFVLKRRQFPLKLCYAMTINKSQG